jgi:hypothetical protein
MSFLNLRVFKFWVATGLAFMQLSFLSAYGVQSLKFTPEVGLGLNYLKLHQPNAQSVVISPSLTLSNRFVLTSRFSVRPQFETVLANSSPLLLGASIMMHLSMFGGRETRSVHNEISFSETFLFDVTLYSGICYQKYNFTQLHSTANSLIKKNKTLTEGSALGPKVGVQAAFNWTEDFQIFADLGTGFLSPLESGQAAKNSSLISIYALFGIVQVL